MKKLDTRGREVARRLTMDVGLSMMSEMELKTEPLRTMMRNTFTTWKMKYLHPQVQHGTAHRHTQTHNKPLLYSRVGLQ